MGAARRRRSGRADRGKRSVVQMLRSADVREHKHWQRVHLELRCLYIKKLPKLAIIPPPPSHYNIHRRPLIYSHEVDKNENLVI